MRPTGLAHPELAQVAVRGMSRGSFILRSALAAGAIAGSAAVGPFVGQALAQDDEAAPDVEIVNFALTLELLEATFYEEALKQVSGLSGDLLALTEEIASNEQEHVSVLTRTVSDLGGVPVDKPRLDFGDAFASEANYLELAQTFEDTGVSAYNGAAPMIQDKSILSAAGTIVQIEGRHAALIRSQRGEPAAPVPFDEALEMAQVLNAVEPFIKS